jgi:hypothetical protein
MQAATSSINPVLNTYSMYNESTVFFIEAMFFDLCPILVLTFCPSYLINSKIGLKLIGTLISITLRQLE